MRTGGRRCFRWPAQVQRCFQQAADAFQSFLCAGMHPPEVTNLVQSSIQAHAASARAPPGLISQRDYALQPGVARNELPWVKWPDEKPQGGFAQNLTPMPQSLSAVYIHFVFSTKERRPFLRAGMHPPEVTNLVQSSIHAHAAPAGAPPGLISQRDYVLQPSEVAVGNREVGGRARTLRGTSYPGSNGQTKNPKGVAPQSHT